MTYKPAKLIRLAAALGTVVFLGTARPNAVRGQGGFTPDPYQPYNAGYDAYIYPNYPSDLGVYPNQNIVQGGRSVFTRQNQFDFYINDLDGGDLSEAGPRIPLRGRAGVPYYAAYRQFDRDYKRIYQPNQEADAPYYEEQKVRHDKYLDWLRERDPKRRAILYREYTQESRKAARDLSDPRGAFNRARATSGAPGARRGETARQKGALPSSGLGTTRTPATSGAATAPSTSSRTLPPRRSPSPTEVLRNAEQLNRANGRTRPEVPSSTPLP